MSSPPTLNNISPASTPEKSPSGNSPSLKSPTLESTIKRAIDLLEKKHGTILKEINPSYPIPRELLDEIDRLFRLSSQSFVNNWEEFAEAVRENHQFSDYSLCKEMVTDEDTGEKVERVVELIFKW